MKERPILFSAPMIRALLAGTKSQTRRVVRLPHGIWETSASGDLVPIPVGCKYGQPGDRLWVRETFCLENTYDYHGDHIAPVDGRPVQKHETADGSYWLIPHYRATEPEPHIVPYRCDGDDDKTRWTPSIFMPRWASRITLEITGVRAERLQDISDADAIAEGCSADIIETWWQGYQYMDSVDDLCHTQTIGDEPPEWMIEPKKMKPRPWLHRDARYHFKLLWESINGPGSWESNPWVWCISFRRID